MRILFYILLFGTFLNFQSKTPYTVLEVNIYSLEQDTIWNFDSGSFYIQGKGTVFSEFRREKDTLKIPFYFNKKPGQSGFNDSIVPFFKLDNGNIVTLFFRCISANNGVFSIVNEKSKNIIHLIKSSTIANYSFSRFFKIQTISISVNKNSCVEVLKYRRTKIKVNDFSEYCSYIKGDNIPKKKYWIDFLFFENNTEMFILDIGNY